MPTLSSVIGVADPMDFLDDENWGAPHITLAIQIGPSTAPDADERALRALRAIWEHPSLEGCYRDRWSGVDDQEPVAPVPSDINEPEHLHGFAILPDGQRVVCFTVISRGSYHDGCDWVALCLPTGALERAGIYAAYLPSLTREELRRSQKVMDLWFVPIAAAVQQAGLRLAVLGEEAPMSSLWMPDGPFEGDLPPERTAGYVVPNAAGVAYHGPST
jgi:hypothetical protein